jgi:hypothetical protein
VAVIEIPLNTIHPSTNQTMKLRLSVLAALGAGLCVFGPLSLRAETVTNLSVADASLFEFTSDNNLGGAVDVIAGSLGSNGNGARNRALFRFDPASQIPGDAVIQSVTLQLSLTLRPSSSAVASEFSLHRVLADWGEGTGVGNQGSPATAGAVTWNNRFHDSVPWTSPGAEAGVDFVAAPSGATYADFPGTYTWASTPEMVADVQFWLQNPGQNYGWLLMSNDENTFFTARRWAAREYPDAALRPKLIIEYTAIPEPGLLALTALGVVGWLGWRRCRS